MRAAAGVLLERADVGVACALWSGAAAARCRCRVLLSQWHMRFGAAMQRHQQRSCRVPLKVLLEGAITAMCALRTGLLTPLEGFDADLLAPLQRKRLLECAAGCRHKVLIQVVCALWSWHANAAARCRSCSCCRGVPLQSPRAAVRVARALWGGRRCFARGGCRVLLSKGCLHVRNLAAETGYCCQSTVRGLKFGCAKCLWQCGCWALMEITLML